MIASLVILLSLAAQKGSAESAPESSSSELAVETSVYTYNPFGKRDPFKSYLSERAQVAVDSSNPLLAWDLSRFSLTGVIWGVANPKAIVKDGNGRGHIISRGARIGRNRGQVVRILKSEVVVQEEFRDPLGKLILSEFTLKLSGDAEKDNVKK